MQDQDKEKIIIMAKMAAYDKRDFSRDARANQYFRHDFIYKKNMSIRFGIGIGCIILVLFYALHLLVVQGVDIFALDFQTEGIRIAIFIIIVMIGYSFLGMVIFTREFIISSRRINKYFALMNQLNGSEDKAERTKLPSKKKISKSIEEEDDEFYEKYEPYRRSDAKTDTEYRIKSSDDPEFWED